MLGLVQADAGNKSFVEGMAIYRETLQCLRHGHNIVVDQQVSHQMVVFDKFALLVADPLGS
jgi:L-rhamnose isomerase